MGKGHFYLVNRKTVSGQGILEVSEACSTCYQMHSSFVARVRDFSTFQGIIGIIQPTNVHGDVVAMLMGKYTIIFNF